MKKQGANGIVTFEGDRATKTLKNRSSDVALKRFAIEIEALRRARDAGVPNIVELLGAELEASPPRFHMRKCAGDIDDLLPLTRNNPVVLASLMLPIVESLHRLATLSTPIFHRDIKPSNLLYDGTADRPTLVLSDFGCAFLADPKAERLTADLRAVGATFFRAPEYSHGRVENVNSSGDIFSIGKLLWYLCNGIPGEVFPYTLWFPEQYNLASRCDSGSVGRLNLIISSCVAHDPVKRISYPELAAALSGLGGDLVPNSDEAERLRLQSYEAELQVRQEETIATFVQLLSALQSDLAWVAAQVSHRYSGTLLSSSVDSLSRFDFSASELAAATIVQHSDMPVANWNTTHVRFHIRAYPPRSAAMTFGSPETGTPFVAVHATHHNTGLLGQMETMLIFFVPERGLMIKTSSGDARPYTRSQLMEYFQSALTRIGR